MIKSPLLKRIKCIKPGLKKSRQSSLLFQQSWTKVNFNVHSFTSLTMSSVNWQVYVKIKINFKTSKSTFKSSNNLIKSGSIEKSGVSYDTQFKSIFD